MPPGQNSAPMLVPAFALALVLVLDAAAAAAAAAAAQAQTQEGRNWGQRQLGQWQWLGRQNAGETRAEGAWRWVQDCMVEVRW